MRLVPSLAAALLVGFALAVLTAHGCSGSCGTNCPANIVQIGSPDLAQLAIPNGGLAWKGPACPTDPPFCTGGPSTTCSFIDVYGIAEGSCDLLISFTDRQPEIVHTQFGPRITQGCCAGFSVVGPSVFYIPDSPNQLIYADGGTDAISFLPDGSADGGDARDAGAGPAADADRDSRGPDAP
jgi:hypothetical protein